VKTTDPLGGPEPALRAKSCFWSSPARLSLEALIAGLTFKKTVVI